MKKHLVFCLFLLSTNFSYCFVINILESDTIKYLREAPINHQDTAVIIKDTTQFKKIKTRFSKKKWTKVLYDAIVNVPKSPSEKDDYSIDKEYQPYKGRKIENITVVSLPPFGTSVYYPDSIMDDRWWVHSANKVHFKTQEKAVVKNLLFHKGETVDPLVFAETEAFLRSTGFIHDVRIVIDTIGADENETQITVIVRDKFPIAFGIRSVNTHSFDFEVFDKNVAHTGSELYLRSIYNHNYIPSWGYGIEGKYNNIAKSFVNIEGKYLDQITEKSVYASVERPLRITLKDYGKISYEQSQRRLSVSPWDSISPPYYNAFSSALGYAFRLNSSPSSVFFSIAGAYYNYRSSFSSVGMSPVPMLYEFTSRQTFLAQINFYRQRYYRQSMIHNFGVVENVAYGFLFSGQAGYDMIPNYFYAPYFSLKANVGKQFPFGNVNYYVAIGSHVKNGKFNSGVFATNTYFFTPLMKLGSIRFRQFLNVNYATSLDKKNELFDYIYYKTLSIMKINSLNDIKGFKRLMVNLESDFFTPIRIIGFRMVAFTFFDGGWTSNNYPLLSIDNFNWGVGLGIRLRNDLLVFKTLVLKIGFYPTVHQNIGDFFNVTTFDPTQGYNFLPTLPQVIRVN